MIPQGSPSCYNSAMRNLVVLFIDFITTLTRLLGSDLAASAPSLRSRFSSSTNS